MRDYIMYNVYCEDVNRRIFRQFNVFNHGGFAKDTQKNFKKNKDNREAFGEQLRKDAMYYFWSKCEWEIIVSSWPPSDRTSDVKVDVYDQLMMNWDIFEEYVWNHRKELNKHIKQWKVY